MRAKIEVKKGRDTHFVYDAGPEEVERLKYENDVIVIREWGRYKNPNHPERKRLEEIVNECR